MHTCPKWDKNMRKSFSPFLSLHFVFSFDFTLLWRTKQQWAFQQKWNAPNQQSVCFFFLSFEFMPLFVLVFHRLCSFLFTTIIFSSSSSSLSISSSSSYSLLSILNSFTCIRTRHTSVCASFVWFGNWYAFVCVCFRHFSGNHYYFDYWKVWHTNWVRVQLTLNTGLYRKLCVRQYGTELFSSSKQVELLKVINVCGNALTVFFLFSLVI